MIYHGLKTLEALPELHFILLNYDILSFLTAFSATVVFVALRKLLKLCIQ